MLADDINAWNNTQPNGGIMYIAFEGVDGAGKSTMSGRAADYLKTYHHAVQLTRHPGATALGQKLRHLIKHDHEVQIDPFTERLLFLCDNSAFVNTLLKKTIEENGIMIADRSNFISDIAYGQANGIDMSVIFKLHSLIEAPKIDILFLFWCPWEIAKVRMMQREEIKCKIEERGDKFFRVVNEVYRQMLDPNTIAYQQAMRYTNKIIPIDAGKPLENVWDDIKMHLDHHFTSVSSAKTP